MHMESKLFEHLRRSVANGLLIALFFFAYFNVANAQERRIALLIGNEEYPAAAEYYEEGQTSKGIIQDLDNIGEALIKIDFRAEDIYRYENLSEAEIYSAINDFEKKITEDPKNTISVVYFSGHGGSRPSGLLSPFGVYRQNFILPVDIESYSKKAFRRKAIPLDRLLEIYEYFEVKAAYVFIDAARREFALTPPGRGRVDSLNSAFVPQTSENATLMFSTDIGEITDSDGRFSKYIAEHIMLNDVFAYEALQNAASIIERQRIIDVEYRSNPSRPFLSLAKFDPTCFVSCMDNFKLQNYLVRNDTAPVFIMPDTNSHKLHPFLPKGFRVGVGRQSLNTPDNWHQVSLILGNTKIQGFMQADDLSTRSTISEFEQSDTNGNKTQFLNIPVNRIDVSAFVKLLPGSSLALSSTQTQYAVAFFRSYPVLEKYEIDSPIRIAHFLSQGLIETNFLKYRSENLNYSGDSLRKIFATRVTEEDAKRLHRNPEAIANHIYGNRMGNTEPGDGWKYRGRGFYQIVGKNNYRRFGEIVGVDLESNPELLEKDLRLSIQVAAAFWANMDLNAYADQNNAQAVSRGINRGNPESSAAAQFEPDRIIWSQKMVDLLTNPAPILKDVSSSENQIYTSGLKQNIKANLSKLCLYNERVTRNSSTASVATDLSLAVKKFENRYGVVNVANENDYSFQTCLMTKQAVIDAMSAGRTMCSAGDIEYSEQTNSNCGRKFSELRVGSRGTRVTKLQEQLRELGYYDGKMDGSFGQATQRAIINFQFDNGIDPTGIVDVTTDAAISEAPIYIQ